MLSLFSARLAVDEDELEFQLAGFKWLQQEFGAVGATELVLPTREFFPPIDLGGHAAGEALFAQVKAAAGMADWPCELRPGWQDRPIDLGNTNLLRHEGESAPCGTFEIREEGGTRRVSISYNPAMVRDKAAMIATFAHELGHYLMSSARSAPPGGWDLHELHTDLCAVYLGFGIFLANGARSFAQFQSGGQYGWSSRTQGYLSEGALVTATAIFQRLAGRDPLDAAPHLKTYLESDLKRASKVLARRFPDMAAAVSAVDLSAFAAD